MKTICHLGFVVVLILTVLSCKNYHNEAIHWIDSIPKNTHISTVQESQPSFIEINWEDPKVIDSSKIYSVKNIQGNNDILKMHYQLVFVNDKFVMRISKK